MLIFAASKKDTMITVNDIAVQFGGTTLFSEVPFAINENDKIAMFNAVERRYPRKKMPFRRNVK